MHKKSPGLAPPRTVNSITEYSVQANSCLTFSWFLGPRATSRAPILPTLTRGRGDGGAGDGTRRAARFRAAAEASMRGAPSWTPHRGAERPATCGRRLNTQQRAADKFTRRMRVARGTRRAEARRPGRAAARDVRLQALVRGASGEAPRGAFRPYRRRRRASSVPTAPRPRRASVAGSGTSSRPAGSPPKSTSSPSAPRRNQSLASTSPHSP